MAANKVSPTSPKIIEKRRAKAEEKEAAASAARLKAKTIVDQTRTYARKLKIFQRSDAVEEIGRGAAGALTTLVRSEEHTSELQSLMRISYDDLCVRTKQPTTY